MAHGNAIHLSWFDHAQSPNYNDILTMSNIKFTQEELTSLRAHYLNEKVRLEAALNHVDAMLVKLGGAIGKRASKSLTAKGRMPKKRGPKSVWGAFIVKRLRARNRPMSYDELIEDAMAIHKIDESRRGAAKASILNSAFRLRTVHGKIVTVGRPGKKDKLVALTKWVGEDGSLQAPHAQTFKTIMGGKAAKVDMASIPTSPYEDGDLG